MKRIFTMLMAVAVLGSIVAGCGGEEKKEPAADPPKEGTDAK